MKVGILTMFNGLDTTYSLVSVVAEQIRMLLDANIETSILVCEHISNDEKIGVFNDERLKWVKVCNVLNGQQIHWHDYSLPDGVVHSTFFEEAEVIAQDLVNKLSDLDVCILHDILYQGWHLVHNVALRMAQKDLPNLRFISFSHSVPNNRPNNPKWPFSARYTGMPNTTFIALSYSAITPLAQQYNIPEGRCRVIYNSIDLLSGLSDDVRKLNERFDLLSPDILIIYPGRLTTGKKFEKVSALGGAIRKKTEKKVKIVFCDFPSADINPGQYKDIIRKTGIESGLEENDIAFTTDYGYPQGFPRKAVLDLFLLSNLFICPSLSESFSLTTLEAASRGNFLVLNQAVPALEELGKRLNAYFLRWDARNYGYDTFEQYQPSEQSYYEENSEKIVNQMRENAVLQAKTLARQRYSPKWVWENQMLPLLEE